MILTPTSFDGNAINDGTNFKALFIGDSGGGVMSTEAIYVPRSHYPPAFANKRQSERTLTLVVIMRGTVSTQRETLKKYFDPAVDSGEKQLIATDDAAAQWYIYATPVGVPNIANNKFYVTLKCGDPVWQTVTVTTNTRNQTASGQTWAITPTGNQNTYPIYEIKPTSAKAGGFGYSRFVAVRNPGSNTFTNYPYDVGQDAFDTAALVTAVKMQADGDDLRVYVDGVETNRWLDGINTTTTKVWINANWSPKQEATLGTAIAASGAVASVVASTSIAGFPSSGILRIDDEIFTYTGKVDGTKTFTGTTRATKGSAMAAHTTTDTIYWIEHDITIYYGNSTMAAPTTDDTKKPIFNLATSTNTSWDYDDFRDGDASQSGIWTKGGQNIYTGNQGGSADPAGELGIGATASISIGDDKYWQLYSPAGVTNWTFANGEKYRGASLWWSTVALQRSVDGASWTTEYNIPTPSAAITWEAWSDAARALGATGYYVRLYATYAGTPGQLIPGIAVEAADVTLTLASGGVPVTFMEPEAGAYQLQCTLYNNTAVLSVTLDATMALNQTIEIDTEDKTVIYLADNSNVMASFSISTTRHEWLSLLPQANTLQFDETGLVAVTITTKYKQRNN